MAPQMGRERIIKIEAASSTEAAFFVFHFLALIVVTRGVDN